MPAGGPLVLGDHVSFPQYYNYPAQFTTTTVGAWVTAWVATSKPNIRRLSSNLYSFLQVAVKHSVASAYFALTLDVFTTSDTSGTPYSMTALTKLMTLPPIAGDWMYVTPSGFLDASLLLTTGDKYARVQVWNGTAGTLTIGNNSQYYDGYSFIAVPY